MKCIVGHILYMLTKWMKAAKASLQWLLRIDFWYAGSQHKF